MFKRGGSTQGTGIMSHVEPRVKAAMGFPTFGLRNQPSQTEIDAFRKAEADRINKIRNQPNFFLGPRFTNPNYQSPFKNFFSTNTGFGFLNLGIPDKSGITATIGGKDTGFIGPSSPMTGAELGITDEYYDYDINEKKEQKEKAKELEKSLNIKGDDDDKPTITLDKRSNLEQMVEDESAMLKRLLDDQGYSKGEAALLISKALKEPGGLKAKIDKAVELGGPIAAKRRSEDKAITLAAYKLAKQKEIAEGKRSSQQQQVDDYVATKLADPTNTKSANELRQEYYNSYIKGDQQKEVNIALLTKYVSPDPVSGKSPYSKAVEDKTELEAKQAKGTLTTSQQEKLDRANRIIKMVEDLQKTTGVKIPTFASGGRAGFAEGTDPMTDAKIEEKVEETVKPIEATNIPEGDQSVPMKPVQKLSYEDLRNRLPKEITNDIVQLIANSEEALQDFAYIRDQEDVSSFNVKYGVNLILPPETV